MEPSFSFFVTVYSPFSITCGELAESRHERQPALQLTIGASMEKQRQWLQDDMLLSQWKFYPKYVALKQKQKFLFPHQSLGSVHHFPWKQLCLHPAQGNS